MILKKLTINHFGPFSSPTVLEVSSNTTVITGANDTGKSSILRLISIIFGERRGIQKREYNISKLAKSRNSWDEDSQWYCDAEFEVPSDFQDRLNSLIDLLRSGLRKGDEDVRISIPLLSGDKITLRYYLASKLYVPDTLGGYKPVQLNGKRPDTTQLAALSDHNLHFFLPNVVGIFNDNGSALYNTDAQLTNLTNDLLNIAFEKRGFPGDDIKLENLSREDLRSAAEHLNEKVQQLFNQSINLKFRFEFSEIEELKSPDETDLKLSLLSRVRALFRTPKELLEVSSKRRIDLYIEDSYRGETRLSYRGAGVIKLAYLICKLLDWRINHGQNIILLDEPENSLHADSQHTLRIALEGLAQNLHTQVIYTTHSPSMINSIQAESIRLVKREVKDSYVTSVIDNQPFNNNFLPIRASLGLSPADSLLYAPVTIIVEGITEVLCIPFLLKRFHASGISGFEKSEHLLSLVHFFNGEGSAFEYFCRLAKSQGNKVIIFVDGDKKKEIKKLDIEIKHPDVAVIILEDSIEFEQIIPLPIYLQALGEITGKSVLPENFDEWQRQSALPEKMMFSKRVDKWMIEVFGHSYSKPEVMRRAIEIADISVIDSEPFKKLMQAIKMVAQ